MIIAKFINILLKNGVIIKVTNDKLKIDAPNGFITTEIRNTLTKYKYEIIEYLSSNINNQLSFKVIPKVNKIKSYYMLSSAQKRLYILQKMDLSSTAYNIPQMVQIGEVTKEELERAVSRLIERHESFRTSFEVVNDEPMQKIHDEVAFEVESYAVSDTAEIDRIFKQFIRPFDLNKAPLLRVGIIRTVDNNNYLLVDMHHIISDGTSMELLKKDFMALLNGEELEPLRLQYKDYSEWQHSQAQQAEMKRQEEYWLKLFADEIPVLNLPYDYVRPVTQSFEGATVNFAINESNTRKIREICKETNTTLSMVLLAVYNILLSKLSGQEDIVLGIGIANRRHADLEKIIGMFVNTLALRNYPNGELSFREFLNEVKSSTLSAYENQEYQFEDLVEKVSVVRDFSRNPIFDVCFNMLNIGNVEESTQSTAEAVIHRSSISKFDMTLTARDSINITRISLEYCTKLFKSDTIDRFIQYFNKLIEEISFEKKLSEIEIISDTEKERILHEFNDTATDYPRDKTIHELFEEQVERTPDNVSLVFENSQLSYSELNKKSNQLARTLREKGVKADDIVGIMIERSLEMIIGIMGILKAGGAYLPIDPEYPDERKLFMLEDNRCNILLTLKKSVKNYSFTNLQNLIPNKEIVNLSPPRIQSSNFDDIPVIDRSLIDYERYFNNIGQGMVKNSITIQATRGCPYDCAYCCRVWPKKYNYRSAENIFKEVKQYYDFGVKRFVFIDDIFNLDIDNSLKFFKLVIKNKLKIHMLFPSGLRGDILTEEYIDIMVKAGVVSFPLALETASPRLQKMIKKNLNLEKFKKNIEYILEKYPNIILELHTMHGFPTETEEEAKMTLDFIKKFKNIHFPYIHILKVYANTDMEEIAIKNGISREAILKSQSLSYHELPMTLPFKKSFTLKYQAEFFNDYFMSKDRLLQVLPYQLKVLTESELLQKYDSYLPVKINSINELLNFFGIKPYELDSIKALDENEFKVHDFNKKCSSLNPKIEPLTSALKILLLDLSQLFTSDSEGLYDVVEQPLGIMSLLTYLNQKYGEKINGKIFKSRIDFNSFDDLKDIVLDFNPDIIGIRTLSIYRDFFHKTVSLIRNWNIDVPIIAGGPYATISYQSILTDNNVDLAVIGEGEITLSEIIGAMIDNNNILPKSDVINNISGIAYRKAKAPSREIIFLEELEEGLKTKSNINLSIINKPSDLAYVICTSGTTGKPKGVMTTHYNVTRVVKNTNYIEIKENDIILQLSNYAFDGSVFDIYGAFLNGARLELISKEEILSIEKLTNKIQKRGISVFFVTTALFNALVEENVDSLSGVRKILFGGERVSVEHCRRALSALGPGKIIHVYGPTEATVFASYYFINSIYDNALTIPIGTPLSNTTIYIHDSHGNLCPIGITGELYIGGSGNALGYLGDEKLTSKKFVNNPYKKGETLYRTGDLCRWLPDGNIEFLGRIDHQVKIRGFRIELGEIESQLLCIDGIREAVVIAKEDKGDQKYIVAYIVSEAEIETSELRSSLSKILPDYMIPAYFVRLDKIPLTSNGKIDRRALPDPEIVVKDYVAPRNEIEKKLVEIWSEVLGINGDKISIDANFFEFGGNSFNTYRLINKINHIFKCEIINYNDIAIKNNIESLAYCIESKINTKEAKVILEINCILMKKFRNNVLLTVFHQNEENFFVLLTSHEYSNNIEAKKIVMSQIPIHYCRSVNDLNTNYLCYSTNNDEKIIRSILNLKSEITIIEYNNIKRELEEKINIFNKTLSEGQIIRSYPCSDHYQKLFSSTSNEFYISLKHPFNNIVEINQLTMSIKNLIKSQSLLRSEISKHEGIYLFVEKDIDVEEINIPILDLSFLDPMLYGNTNNQISDYFTTMLIKKGIVNNPLYSILLVKYNDTTYHLIMVVHHSIFDAESLLIITRMINENLINQKESFNRNDLNRCSYKDYLNDVKFSGIKKNYLINNIFTKKFRDAVNIIKNKKYNYIDNNSSFFSPPIKIEFNYYGENVVTIALHLAIRIIKEVLDEYCVPIKVVCDRRNVGKYRNTVGDFHDFTPILITKEDETPERCKKILDINNNLLNENKLLISEVTSNDNEISYLIENIPRYNFYGERNTGIDHKQITPLRKRCLYDIECYTIKGRCEMILLNGFELRKYNRIKLILNEELENYVIKM